MADETRTVALTLTLAEARELADDAAHFREAARQVATIAPPYDVVVLHERFTRTADILSRIVRESPPASGAGTPDAWLVERKDGTRPSIAHVGSMDPREVHESPNCNYVPLYRVPPAGPTREQVEALDSHDFVEGDHSIHHAGDTLVGRPLVGDYLDRAEVLALWPATPTAPGDGGETK